MDEGGPEEQLGAADLDDPRTPSRPRRPKRWPWLLWAFVSAAIVFSIVRGTSGQDSQDPVDDTITKLHCDDAADDARYEGGGGQLDDRAQPATDLIGARVVDRPGGLSASVSVQDLDGLSDFAVWAGHGVSYVIQGPPGSDTDIEFRNFAGLGWKARLVDPTYGPIAGSDQTVTVQGNKVSAVFPDYRTAAGQPLRTLTVTSRYGSNTSSDEVLPDGSPAIDYVDGPVDECTSE
jgi:hypothetical protein